MANGEYFHQPDPEDPIYGPQLPERYWTRSLADLYPDTVVYPSVNVLAVNEADNKLYIKLATNLDESAYDWSRSTYHDRIGLLRVYTSHPVSGRTIDGFIADVRPLTSLRTIERVHITTYRPRHLDDYYRYTGLLGVIYKATDGTNRYSADPLDYAATEDDAYMLAQHMDAITHSPQTGDTHSSTGIESVAPHRRPLPGPGPSAGRQTGLAADERRSKRKFFGKNT